MASPREWLRKNMIQTSYFFLQHLGYLNFAREVITTVAKDRYPRDSPLRTKKALFGEGFYGVPERTRTSCPQFRKLYKPMSQYLDKILICIVFISVRKLIEFSVPF